MRATGERRRDGAAVASRPAVVVATVLALVAVVTGCAGQGDPSAAPGSLPPASSAPSGPQVLTAKQSSTLSLILFKNWDAGGATIDADIPFGSAAFHLHADVDWKGGRGRGSLDTSYADSRAPEHARVAWTEKQVALTDAGGQWQQRLMAPNQYPLDQVLVLIDALASEQRDNPALLRQGDARYAGTDRVGSVDVDVFTFGERSTYLVDGEGRLVRVRAVLGTTTKPAIIDITGVGPRVVELPA
jgi:hypothetical protein